ncbi:MAG TPA: alpha/beta hydrolase [Humisphaera sp.]
MRIITPLLLLLLACPLQAAEPKVSRDVAYAEPKEARRTLDVYAPPDAKARPIVVWVHGGGWRSGDKAGVKGQPKAFVDRGFVYVATNYRFVPAVTVKEQAGDVAKAVAYVRRHAADLGGDPGAIYLMGHSSGAHVVALVCTDEQYLKAEGLPLSAVKGCVPIDTSFHDIPKRVKDGGDTKPQTIREIFTDRDEFHRDVSPALHVGAGKGVPPFLIVHLAARADTTAQADWFAGKLKAAGVAADTLPVKGKTHGAVGTEIGVVDDEATRAVFAFLNRGRAGPTTTPAK